MGDVKDHLVGPGPLHFKVAVTARRHGDGKTVLLGQSLGVDRLQPLAGVVKVIHLDAKMVNAVVTGPLAPTSASFSVFQFRIARLIAPSGKNTAPVGLRLISFHPKAAL
jgi:hypothetical protein